MSNLLIKKPDDLYQLIDNLLFNKTNMFNEKMNKYREKHRDVVSMIQIDFAQMLFDKYLKATGYSYDHTKMIIDFRTIRLIWLYYCETFDFFGDKTRSYNLVLDLINYIIKIFINSTISWQRDYCIRIEHIYKNKDLFPLEINYQLTIYFINFKLKDHILKLVHYIIDKNIEADKNLEVENNKKRKVSDTNLDNNSNKNNSEKENNWISPESDYFTFLATDQNPTLAHKQYVNLIDSMFFFFKTSKQDFAGEYRKKLSNSDDPDSTHREIRKKIMDSYAHYMEYCGNSNSNLNPNPYLPSPHGSIITSSPVGFNSYPPSPVNYLPNRISQSYGQAPPPPPRQLQQVYTDQNPRQYQGYPQSPHQSPYQISHGYHQQSPRQIPQDRSKSQTQTNDWDKFFEKNPNIISSSNTEPNKK